jgi:hypothetical protein
VALLATGMTLYMLENGIVKVHVNHHIDSKNGEWRASS